MRVWLKHGLGAAGQPVHQVVLRRLKSRHLGDRQAQIQAPQRTPDGAVKPITQNVNLTVFQNLANIANAQAVPQQIQ